VRVIIIEEIEQSWLGLCSSLRFRFSTAFKFDDESGGHAKPADVFHPYTASVVGLVLKPKPMKAAKIQFEFSNGFCFTPVLSMSVLFLRCSVKTGFGFTVAQA